MMRLFLLALVACASPRSTAIDSRMADAALPDAAPTTCKLVELFGQSNAGSKGHISELIGSDVALAVPLPAVPFAGVVGNAGTTAARLISYPLGLLAPQIDYLGRAGTFGFELSMGHALNDAEPGQWAIAKYSIGSTGLDGAWDPFNPYYPIPPVGSGSSVPNLYQADVDLVQSVAAATGCQVAAMIWIQGEEDAAGVTVPPSAGQYGLRLIREIAAHRYSLAISQDVPFFVGRLNALYPGAGVALVRAGEESVASSHVIVVDQDPYPLGPDGIHYSTAGIVELGRVYAAAILGAL